MKARASSCGCCEGVEKLTRRHSQIGRDSARCNFAPALIRPFAANVSTVSSAAAAKISVDAAGQPILAGLTTRDPDDPAIALLDGWAMVADVLTFYDERIANEGYLRTATERRSVLELARLVGYAPRPGVSATAYLAYTIDGKDRSVTPPKGMEVTIPAGSRAQSTPGPNELPQTFETFEALPSRTAWNKLQPRLKPPANRGITPRARHLFKGTATNLKPNDPLLLDLRAEAGALCRARPRHRCGRAGSRTYITVRPWWRSAARIVALAHFAQARRNNLPEDPDRQKVFDILNDLVESAQKSASEFQTHLGDILGRLIEVFKDVSSAGRATAPWLDEIIAEVESAQEDLADSLRFENPVAAKAERRAPKIFDLLAPAPSILPRSSISLGQTLATTLKTGSDVFPRLMTRFRPALGNVLTSALANATIAPPTDLKVYALRVSTSLFGHNLPDQPIFNDDGKRIDTVVGTLNTTWKSVPLPSATDTFAAIALDAEYEQVKTNDFIVIDRAEAHEFPVIDHVVGLKSPIPKAASAPLVGAAVTIHTVRSASTRTLNALGISAKSTVATISPDWFSDTRSAVGNARGCL